MCKIYNLERFLRKETVILCLDFFRKSDIIGILKKRSDICVS